MDMLGQGLSAAWLRNTVIRNNIANIETPGFKASGVEFESILARSLQGRGFTATTTHVGHRDFGSGNVQNITPRVFQRNDLSMRADGNNVDIDAENVRLAQNSLYYNTIMEKLNSEIRRMRTAITEGRGILN
jgi:flagellar basal-body rod protein FlgB